MEKYGVLLEGIDIAKIGKPLAIATVLIFIYRKLVIAISVIYLIPYPVFSIFVFNMTTLVVIMFVEYVKPFDTKKLQFIKLSQEIIIIGISYHLFCFTDFVEIDMRSNVGKSVIYIIAG